MSDAIEQVGPIDPEKQTSPIDDTVPEEPSEPKRDTPCWFNGAQYGAGAEICSAGSRLRCYTNGRWSRVGSC